MFVNICIGYIIFYYSGKGINIIIHLNDGYKYLFSIKYWMWIIKKKKKEIWLSNILNYVKCHDFFYN